MNHESLKLRTNLKGVLVKAIDHFQGAWDKKYKDAAIFIFENTHELLDKDFTEKLYHDFPSRFSELLFSYVFKCNFKLSPIHKSDSGPDLWLETIGVWAEIVTATNGDLSKPDSLRPNEKHVEYKSENNKKLLRLTNALSTKSKKYVTDIQNKRASSSDKTIICLNGGWLENWLPNHPENGLPDIVRAVYPAGDYQLIINAQTNKIVDHEYTYQNTIQKTTPSGSQSPVFTDSFLSVENSHISGVLYCYNAGNFLNPDKIGEDFVFVHNVLAQNKIALGEIRVAEEYTAEINGDLIQISKHLNDNVYKPVS